MIRMRRSGTRAFVVGVAVAAVACGSAAAAMPGFSLRVRAHLAPAAGTTAGGEFRGALAENGGGASRYAPSAIPWTGSHWRLSWQLRLPALGRRMSATLRIGAEKGAAPVARVLCTQCATDANGTIGLTASDALRIAGSRAFVVVSTPSAKLRGRVRAFANILPAAAMER